MKLLLFFALDASLHTRTQPTKPNLKEEDFTAVRLKNGTEFGTPTVLTAGAPSLDFAREAFAGWACWAFCFSSHGVWA